MISKWWQRLLFVTEKHVPARSDLTGAGPWRNWMIDYWCGWFFPVLTLSFQAFVIQLSSSCETCSFKIFFRSDRFDVVQRQSSTVMFATACSMMFTTQVRRWQIVLVTNRFQWICFLSFNITRQRYVKSLLFKCSKQVFKWVWQDMAVSGS